MLISPLINLLPEIFILFFGVILLVFLALLVRRDSSKLSKNINQQRAFTLNILTPTWFLVFLLTIIYLLLIIVTPNTFITDWGVASTKFIYSLRIILTFTFLIYLLYIKSELKSFLFYSYEFLIVLLFSFVTLNLLLISTSILNIFIFIELFSICSYYLIVSYKNNVRSLESGIKYFIFGSLGSVFLLFGFFLLYQSTGLTNLSDIYLLSSSYESAFSLNYSFVVASFFISLSLLFKLGAGFYYFWIIDIYNGINYPMLIFLNIFAKIVYIFVLFSFLQAFDFEALNLTIKIIISLSLIIGAVGAIYQVKVKKFLIFSSLYNIAFFSIAFWDLNIALKSTFLIFSFLYILNTMFLIIAFSNIKDWETNSVIKNLSDLPSLLPQNKNFAYLLIFTLFTSAGLPPFTIFFAKFFIFFEISRELSFVWFFLFILASTFAFFYYIRISKLILQRTKTISFFFKPLKPLIAYILTFHIFLNVFVIIFYDKLLLLASYFCV